MVATEPQQSVKEQTLDEKPDRLIELSTFSIYSSVFPALTVLSFLCAVVGSFYFTISQNHYTSYLPSFSDIGDYPPERCFFSFFINTSAFFWLCTAYFIYVTLTVHLHTFMDMNASWALTVVIFNFFGFMIGLGLALIANFQESNLKTVHQLGYGMLLIAALFYQWGYIVICFNLRPRLEPNYRPVIISRVIIAFVFTLVLLTRAGMTFKNPIPSDGNRTFVIKMRDPNVENQTVSLYLSHDGAIILNHAIEWAALVIFNLFVITFTSELDGFDVKTVGKKVGMKESEASVKNESPEIPSTTPLESSEAEKPVLVQQSVS